MYLFIRFIVGFHTNLANRENHLRNDFIVQIEICGVLYLQPREKRLNAKSV